MTDDAAGRSLRRALAQSTRARHEALHRHPVFARLLAPDLSQPEYAASLRVMLTFLVAVEAARSRVGAFPALGLAAAVAALRRDLGDGADRSIRMLDATAAPSVLGALYVAHGAQFGRQVIGRAVGVALPNVRHHYFQAHADTGAWHCLLSTLNTYPGQAAAERICDGAVSAFDFVAQLADTQLSGGGLACDDDAHASGADGRH